MKNTVTIQNNIISYDAASHYYICNGEQLCVSGYRRENGSIVKCLRKKQTWDILCDINKKEEEELEEMSRLECYEACATQEEKDDFRDSVIAGIQADINWLHDNCTEPGVNTANKLPRLRAQLSFWMAK